MSSDYEKYINLLFADGSSCKPGKKFWKSIKAKERNQVAIPPLHKNGKFVASSKEMAQVLNEQYQNVFIDEDLENIPDMGNSPYPGMPSITLSINGIKQLLQKLNPKKAAGPDMVPTSVERLR